MHLKLDFVPGIGQMFGNEISMSLPDYDMPCRKLSHAVRIWMLENITRTVEKVVSLVVHASGLDVHADLSGT